MIISVAIYNKTLSLVRKRFELIAMTFDFLSLIQPGWVVIFLDSHLVVLIFSSWFDLLDVVLVLLIPIFKSHRNNLHIVQISQAENAWEVLEIII